MFSTVEGFFADSFSSTTPPAEPARPAAWSEVAALRERGLVEAAEAALGPGDWGFVDIVIIQGGLPERRKVF